MLLSSNEIKSVLKISDCTLMHLRMSGALKFEKRGKSFYYQLPEGASLLSHPLGDLLINWYQQRHNVQLDNSPVESESRTALEKLVKDILLPIARKYGDLQITYGFTSLPLHKFIAKHSPKGTCPLIDQHAAFEKNNRGKPICHRGGAACDITTMSTSSGDLARFISADLDFDRLYFYGNDRPLHVSVHPKVSNRHLQVMGLSEHGRRYPKAKAFGVDAIKLAGTL